MAARGSLRRAPAWAYPYACGYVCPVLWKALWQHTPSRLPARTHTLTGSLCPHSLGQFVVPSMVAGAVDDTTSSMKYARLLKLDPSKQEDFRAWAMTLKASLSTAASSALELGKPTRAI